MKEAAIHAAALQQAHRSSVAVGKNRFRVLLGDRTEFCCDRVQRFIPRNAFELSIAFAARPLHWIEQSICVVCPFFVMRDFHAKAAMRVGIAGITFHAHGAAMVIDFDEHGARVGTIVWTDGANNFHLLMAPPFLEAARYRACASRRAWIRSAHGARFPVVNAACFMESTSSSRWWYKRLVFLGGRFCIAYAVRSGNATVESR